MRLSLVGEIADDQDFLEKELLEFDPSKIIEEGKSSFVDNSLIDSPKQKHKTITNKKTPY